jgi:hypothetical protein
MNILRAAETVCALLAILAGTAAQASPYVLKAARLFDGTSGQLVTPGIVVVLDGTIQSVGVQTYRPAPR